MKFELLATVLVSSLAVSCNANLMDEGFSSIIPSEFQVNSFIQNAKNFVMEPFRPHNEDDNKNKDDMDFIFNTNNTWEWSWEYNGGCDDNYNMSLPTIEDVIFFNNMTYATWNGFVRGLYREHRDTVIDERCLGLWVANNLTDLGDLLNQVFVEWNFDVSYDQAVQASIDVVNLIYKNGEFCQFSKVIEDLEAFSTIDDLQEGEFLEDRLMAKFFQNFKTNAVQIIARFESIYELAIDEDVTDDEGIMHAVEELAYNYGAIVSYFIGFDQRFSGVVQHKFRKFY